MNLEKWATVFLNKHTSIARFLCDVGIFHTYVSGDDKPFCKFCKKEFDKWDVFTWFKI